MTAMNLENNRHPIQVKILRTLLFKESARFSDLNPLKLSSDHFSFHVNKLLQDKVIEKNNDGLYYLTIAGKEYANRLNTDKEILEKQAKLAVLIVCRRESQNKTEY